MRIFEPLYQRAMQWAANRRAPLFLVVLSFFEAIIFPVPPEVMLAPMSLAQPKRGLWFATLSLSGSIIGGLVGYTLGHFAFAALQPVIDWLGWRGVIDAQVANIANASPWKVFGLLVLAGFTPIPLKIFTWSSGIVGVPLLPFIVGMMVGRGKRVYFVAGAIRLGGVRAESALRRWIEPIGWVASVLFIALVGWLVWKVKHAG